MSITPGTLRAVQQLRAGIAGVVDAQARDLVAAWAAAWDEVAGELRDAVNDLVDAAAGGRVTKAQIGRSGRLLAALAHITDQLVGLAAAAGVRVIADLAGVVEQAGAAQVAAIGSQLPFAGQERVVTWDRVDRAAVDAIVSRTAEAITAASRPLGGDAARAVRRELVRGVVVGDNPRAVARRIVTRAGAAFHGGLTRALVISRTEMADASRAASRAADLANKDVLTGWVWQASLGPRTCPACWAMHGTVHALTDPGPLGHPQCRCTRTPVARTWAELGFPGVEEPPSVFPDAAGVFDGMPPAQQMRVLGPARYAAWRAGQYPMGSWAARRSNPGWRDSYTVSPAPARASRAA